MESEGLIDIFNFVRHMRFRRNYMVQTAPQYVFIHDALLEAIMCGDNSIPAPELRKRLQDLMEVDPESKKSKLQLQFEVSEWIIRYFDSLSLSLSLFLRTWVIYRYMLVGLFSIIDPKPKEKL